MVLLHLTLELLSIYGDQDNVGYGYLYFKISIFLGRYSRTLFFNTLRLQIQIFSIQKELIDLFIQTITLDISQFLKLGRNCGVLAKF